MSVALDRQAEESLATASSTEAALRVIENDWRAARTCFIRDAKAAGWSWTRMASALGISDSAVRRLWRDNRMAYTRLGGADEKAETVPTAQTQGTAPARPNGGAGQAGPATKAEVHDGG